MTSWASGMSSLRPDSEISTLLCGGWWCWPHPGGPSWSCPPAYSRVQWSCHSWIPIFNHFIQLLMLRKIMLQFNLFKFEYFEVIYFFIFSVPYLFALWIVVLGRKYDKCRFLKPYFIYCSLISTFYASLGGSYYIAIEEGKHKLSPNQTVEKIKSYIMSYLICF